MYSAVVQYWHSGKSHTTSANTAGAIMAKNVQAFQDAFFKFITQNIKSEFIVEKDEGLTASDYIHDKIVKCTYAQLHNAKTHTLIAHRTKITGTLTANIVYINDSDVYRSSSDEKEFSVYAAHINLVCVRTIYKKSINIRKLANNTICALNNCSGDFNIVFDHIKITDSIIDGSLWCKYLETDGPMFAMVRCVAVIMTVSHNYYLDRYVDLSNIKCNSFTLNVESCKNAFVPAEAESKESEFIVNADYITLDGRPINNRVQYYSKQIQESPLPDIEDIYKRDTLGQDIDKLHAFIKHDYQKPEKTGTATILTTGSIFSYIVRANEVKLINNDCNVHVECEILHIDNSLCQISGRCNIAYVSSRDIAIDRERLICNDVQYV